MRKSKSAFTIVELLIVIVVIAILASITVIGYTSIQQRARSAAWVSALNQWEKILMIYKTEKGEYMNTGGMLMCLGASYPEADGFEANQCYRTVPVEFLRANTWPAMNAAIQEVMGSVPSASVPLVKTTDPAAGNRQGYIRGLMYATEASTNRAYIEYYLDKQTGASGCIGSDVVMYAAYADASKRCRRYLN